MPSDTRYRDMLRATSLRIMMLGILFAAALAAPRFVLSESCYDYYGGYCAIEPCPKIRADKGPLDCDTISEGTLRCCALKDEDIPKSTPAPEDAGCGDSAGSDPYCIKKFAGYAGLTSPGTPPTSLPKIIGNVIRLLLLLTGIIFFLFFFWAGLKWMTARGNQEIVDESQRIMENLALGLGVIIISYAFTAFVMGRFFQ